MRTKVGRGSIFAVVIAWLMAVSALFLHKELYAMRLGDIDIPNEIMGWKAHPEAMIYDREGLFEYIDGGAELYLSYDFKRLWVVEYKRPGGPDLSLNLFEMNSPEGACGVFTAEREGPDVGVGEGSEYDSGLMRFYKGRYFGSITSYPETPRGREAVFALARAISSSIKEKGGVPTLVGLLPKRALDPLSIRYLWEHEILNHFHFVSTENVLELGPDTRAVLAGYGTGGKGAVLLVVRYHEAKRASRALKRWLAGQKGREQALNVQVGPFLILALEARDRELARRVVEEAAAGVEGLK